MRWDKSSKLKAIIVNEWGDRRYKLEDLESYLKKEKVICQEKLVLYRGTCDAFCQNCGYKNSCCE